MKRAVPHHFKTLRLMGLLECLPLRTVGILDMRWWVAGTRTEHGPARVLTRCEAVGILDMLWWVTGYHRDGPGEHRAVLRRRTRDRPRDRSPPGATVVDRPRARPGGWTATRITAWSSTIAVAPSRRIGPQVPAPEPPDFPREQRPASDTVRPTSRHCRDNVETRRDSVETLSRPPLPMPLPETRRRSLLRPIRLVV